MILKIKSDGQGKNTQLINAETGEVVDGVRLVRWECEPGGLAVLKIELIHFEIDGKGVQRDASQMGKPIKDFVEG